MEEACGLWWAPASHISSQRPRGPHYVVVKAHHNRSHALQSFVLRNLAYFTEDLGGEQNTIDFNDICKCKMLSSCVVLLIKKNIKYPSPTLQAKL